MLSETSAVSKASSAIADPLLAFLRGRLGRPALSYREVPEPVQGGFESVIYRFQLEAAPTEFSGPLILRLLRRLDDPERAAREAVVQNTVLRLGFPAPRVMLYMRSAEELGAPFLIMERAPGHTLTPEFEGLGRGRSWRELLLLIVRMPRMAGAAISTLARTQADLHRLPGSEVLNAFALEGLSTAPLTLEGRLDSLIRQAEGFPDLRRVVTWLIEHRPPEPERRVICHCDFQPFNVLVADGKVTAVLDWANAAVGDPTMDVAASVASFVTVPMSVPPAFKRAAYALLWAGRRSFLKAYSRLNPIEPSRLRYYEVLRCVRELSWLAAGAAHDGSGLGAYHSEEGVARLIAHLRRLTKITVRFASI